MPIYTFECNECKKIIELLQDFEDSNPLCFDCCDDGVLMNRLIPKTGRPQFSGSGFYETDYKKDLKKPLDKANGSKDKKNEQCRF